MEYVFYLEAFCEALRDVNHVDVPMILISVV